MSAARRLALVLALPAALLGVSACNKAKPEPEAAAKGKIPKYAVHTGVGPAELGVPFYPGGQQLLGAGRSSVKDGSGRLSAVLDTADSVETVYRWYRQQLGGPLASDILNAGGTEPQATLVKAQGADRVEVAIVRMAGKTRIILTRTQAPRPEPAKSDGSEHKKGSEP